MTFLLYLIWHFYEAPKRILQIWRNYFIFIWHYFSVDLSGKTLFRPWRRDVSLKQSTGFEISEFFENIVFNVFSRIIGFFVRFFTIIFAFILEISLFITGLLIFIFWLILPFLLSFGVYKSAMIYQYGF